MLPEAIFTLICLLKLVINKVLSLMVALGFMAGVFDLSLILLVKSELLCSI